ncbi:alcohol dehydrogenase catalytic domain-containing protein [Blautia producta]|uniref:alcohol dehydrogenase catalytic domain-containing protein n=1 Tax=Blautia producta TaxID=33035 RepID=UPI0021091887|nr:alcohol dehydrogenase catalytic domain-containing protein [Blautia producta]MCQ5126513.1 alcohol dehydrogenase catalytic domain-containing protein [Blautia producta]
MKAAVFYEKNKILVEEHECRRPNADEVMIQVKAAGVCGTDMHIYGGAKGASECYPPVVLGHEFAGMAYLVENYAVGQAIGEETAKWVNENYPDGCEVAVIDYATLPVIVERANGIVDAIKEKAPNAEIVAQDSALNAAEGMTLAENMLQAHKDIKAFACIGDGSGVGVNEAL